MQKKTITFWSERLVVATQAFARPNATAVQQLAESNGAFRKALRGDLDVLLAPGKSKV